MKHLLLKSWLMVAMLLVGVGTGWAQTITPYYNNKAGSDFSITNSNKTEGTVVKDVLTYSAPDATYSSPQWRIAANGSITFETSSAYKIETISMGYSSTGYTGNWSISSGSASVSGTAGTFSNINSSSVTLTTSSAARIKSVKVYYVDNASTYTLTFASNANGTFSAKVDGNTVTSGSKVEAGKTVTLTAEPKDGYVFNAWNVYKTANQYNYVTVSGNNTFTMPSEAVTVDAYFVEGKTIPNAQVSVAAGTYRGEQSVTITNRDEDEYFYYYTLDGSTPEIDGGMEPVGTTQEYTGAINITESCTLSILTTDLEDSKINTFNYVIEYPYTVTIEEPANGTLTVMYGATPVKSGDKFYKGDIITATATPADGYKFRNIQFTDASAHTFTASNVKEWPMGDHDVTISATFDEKQYYTIAFSVNGTTLQSDVLEENTAVSVPDDPADINGKVFTGWIETENVVGETPAYVTPSATASEDVTYYAVFATQSGSGAETWNKVTDASTLAENDVIAIVSSEAVDYNIKGSTTKYNGYIAMGKTQNNNNRAGVVVTVADDVLTINDDVQQITLTKATFSENTDWQFGVDGGYLYANSSSNNYLKTQETNNVNGLWNISITDGKATIYAKFSSYTRNYIRVNGQYQNSTTAAPLVTAYKSDATTGVLSSIYKKNGGASYSDYTTFVGYTRSVTEGNYGTICLPCETSKVEGATIYNIVGTKKTDSQVSGIVLEENDGNMVAGKPYIFKATASELSATYTGNAVNAPVSATGLVGNLSSTPLNVTDGNYVLSSNKIRMVNGGTATVGQNRAYINLSGVAEYVPSGARVLFFDFDGTVSEETAINEINQNANESVIYNLNGQRVNKAQKGIYIVNGKKVLFK